MSCYLLGFITRGLYEIPIRSFASALSGPDPYLGSCLETDMKIDPSYCAGFEQCRAGRCEFSSEPRRAVSAWYMGASTPLNPALTPKP